MSSLRSALALGLALCVGGPAAIAASGGRKTNAARKRSDREQESVRPARQAAASRRAPSRRPPSLRSLSNRARAVLDGKRRLDAPKIRGLAEQLHGAGVAARRAQLAASGLEVLGPVQPAAEVSDMVSRLEALARSQESRPSPGSNLETL